MSGETVYLFESQPLDASGTPQTICFSNGLLSEAELQSTGFKYPVRLSQAWTHETSVFEDNSPGDTSVSLGSATINNTDGRFDFLLDYAWDSRPVTIKRGKRGDAYATYTTEFVGSATEITADSDNLTITLRDNSYKLYKQLQPNKYAGTGGAEGGIDLQNKTKPLLFGKARNITAVWVDQPLLTLQIHDGTISSVDGVYDRGNKLNFYADYASYALLAAATIPPGYYATSLASGFLRLGAPPYGALTVDAVGAYGGITNIPNLAWNLLTGRLGLSTSTDVDNTTFSQAATDAPWAFEGIYFPEPMLQYDELIQILADSVFGFWYVSRTGLISFKIFKFSTPVGTIRAEDIMALGKAPSPKPLYRVKVNYGKNSTIQPASDFTIPRQTLNAFLDKKYHYVDTSVGSPDYSGAGTYHAFLNDTEINDLGLATFSVPNGESWITINQLGVITVTAPPTTPASAVLRVNVGEFVWDETFTVVKDSAAPLNKIDLSLSGNRLYFNDAGQPSPGTQNIVATATGVNTTAPITITAVDNLGQNVTVTGGNTVSIGNISPSILVQWIEIKAQDAAGIQQRKRVMVQHGNDAYAQGILGSYASGGATFFFQTTAPSSGMVVNDVWVDTDDANKTYRWNGSVWSQFSDTRIVDALTQAAGAQATADGKIKTYSSTSAPSGGTYAVGDLWYNSTTQELKRWNGSTWSEIVSTVGSTIGTDLRNGPAIVTSSQVVNSAITINANGTLTNAGGGQVTIAGLGFQGDLYATGDLHLIKEAGSNASATLFIGGNRVQRTDALGGWIVNSIGKEYSVGSAFVSGRCETSGVMFGLTDATAISGGNASQSYFELDYGFFANNVTGDWEIYESGSNAGSYGTYTATDQLLIIYDGTQILYYKNGTLLRTVSTTAGRIFRATTAHTLQNGAVTEIVFGSAQVRPRAGVTLESSSGSVVNDGQILNSAVTISSAGVLSGAGGGTVTLGGIAPGVDPNANVAALGDANRTRFSQLEQGTLGYGIIYNPVPLTTNFSTFTSSGKQWLKISNTFTATSQPIAYGSDFTIGLMPVTAGERIFCSAGWGVDANNAGAGGSGTQWSVQVGFLDSSNVEQNGGADRILLGSGSGDYGPARIAAFGIVPAWAVKCFWVWNVNSNTDGAHSTDIFIYEPMICGAAVNQTSWPAFTPGPSGEAGAQVTRWIDGPPQSTTFKYDSSGATAEAGEFNRDLTFKLMTSAGQISSGITWSYKVLNGTFNGFTSASGSQGMSGTGTGTLTATSLGTSTATLEITATYLGKPYTLSPVELSKKLAAAGSGATVLRTKASGFTQFNSTTATDITGALNATTPTGVTTLKVAVALDAMPVSGTSGGWTVNCKVYRRTASGPGAWNLIYTAPTSSSLWSAVDNGGDVAAFYFTVTDSGLSASTGYDYYVEMYLSSGTRTHSVTGQVQITT